VLQKEVPTIKPDVFSPRAQKVKVYSPGLRAPAVGSASSAARAVDLRCVRKWCYLYAGLLSGSIQGSGRAAGWLVERRCAKCKCWNTSSPSGIGYREPVGGCHDCASDYVTDFPSACVCVS
jgi:hypothetical protein